MPRKGQFQPGNKGGGRPKGSLTISTMMNNALRDYDKKNGVDSGQIILENIINKAREGDERAMYWIQDKLFPNVKPLTPTVDIGSIPRTDEALVKKINTLMLTGEIPLEIASAWLDGIKDKTLMVDVKETKAMLEEVLKLNAEKDKKK